MNQSYYLTLAIENKLTEDLKENIKILQYLRR